MGLPNRIERISMGAMNLGSDLRDEADEAAWRGDFDVAGRMLAIERALMRSMLDFRIAHPKLFGGVVEDAPKGAKRGTPAPAGAPACVPLDGSTPKKRHSFDAATNRCERCKEPNPRAPKLPGVG